MSIQDEINVKQQAVAGLLAARKLEGVLFTRRCNFSWYTSGAHSHVNNASDTGLATLLVTAEGATLLTTNIEAERFRGEDLVGRESIELIDYPWHDTDAKAAALAKAVGGRKVAADAPVGGVDAAPMPQAFDELRWVLSEAEIERYRQVAVDVAATLQDVAFTVEPGATERELAGLVRAMLCQRNCLPWVVLVAGEDRVSKYRHPLPTDGRVSKYCMLVCCAERDGLIAAVTRFFHFGKIPADLAAKQRAVVTVDAAMIDATRPGATLGEIFDAGVRMYAEMGHADQWRLHHQGGSCGYLPRDIIATPGDPTVARASQAFAWNPSITGAKSEDTILCTDAGPEIFSLAGDWPTFDVDINGAVYPRPDILAR